MRHIAHIMLLYWSLGSFFPLGDFSQLAMLPALLHHYQLHRAESAEPLSFPAFFSQHYSAAGSHHHDDPLSHHDLPLKTLHECQWIGARFATQLTLCPGGEAAMLCDHSDYSLSEGIRAAVFRPPLSA